MNRIPLALDYQIFNVMLGKYKTRTDVNFNLHNDEEKNKIYLGTYFPRSYVESKMLFSHTLKIEEIYDSFNEKDKISVLDFGTGTGGNIVGLMDAFKEAKINTEKITFYAIEGNSSSVTIANLFVNWFNKQYNTYFKFYPLNVVFPQGFEGFKQKVTTLFNNLNSKFDLITSSKMLNEFYNNNPSQSGYYNFFATTAEKYLTDDGLLFLIDVVSSPNYEQEYTSIVMANELNKCIKNTNLAFIAPFACAKWASICKENNCYTEKRFIVNHSKSRNDITKICYRLLGKKEFVKNISEHRKLPDILKVSDNEKSKKQYCSFGKRIEHKEK